MSGPQNVTIKNHPIGYYIANWVCLVDVLCLIVTLDYYCPHLETKFYKWLEADDGR